MTPVAKIKPRIAKIDDSMGVVIHEGTFVSPMDVSSAIMV